MEREFKMLKIQEIRELIKLIDESSIQEFTYEEDGSSVTMKKTDDTHQNSVPVTEEMPQRVQYIPQQQTVETEPKKQTQAETEQESAQKDENQVDYDYEITSPMVGTLYSSASPEIDPYVHIGSKIEKESIVCIVEAMKLFNEIEAEVSGEVVEILVENGELVEYGQPLFRVKTK